MDSKHVSKPTLEGHYVVFPTKIVNPHLCCPLCGGYFFQATTIVECLHSFCKDCIYKYLDEIQECPICQLPVNANTFDEVVKADNILQSLVDKLFPEIAKRDESIKQEYKRVHGIDEKDADDLSTPDKRKRAAAAKPAPANKLIKGDSFAIPKTAIDVISFHILPLESGSLSLPSLSNSHMRVSGNATISHLKKMLKIKLNLEQIVDVDILCKDEILGSEHSLEYIKKTRWPRPDDLILKYRKANDPSSSH